MAGGFDFSGQCVLVTGGTRGIGMAIARAFLAHGADVVVCGRNAPQSPIEAAGREAVFLQSDIRDSAQVDQLIDGIEGRFGRLDVVVNNAGGSPEVDSATASPRLSEGVIRLNLLAPLLVSQAAYRQMRGQPHDGSIINISSVSAVRPSPFSAAYGAAKAGLLSLTRSLAVEWAPKVRVNAIIAGLVGTEQALDHYGGEEGLRRVAATIPMGRMIAPEDIADACLFLASPMARSITGAALAVDGGHEKPAFLDAAKAKQDQT